MNASQADVDQLIVLSDPIRVRMLAVLEGNELTVSELCDVVQLPQSTVSRHLKTLADGEWVNSRRDGTRRLYTLPLDDVDASAAGHGDNTMSAQRRREPFSANHLTNGKRVGRKKLPTPSRYFAGLASGAGNGSTVRIHSSNSFTAGSSTR